MRKCSYHLAQVVAKCYMVRCPSKKQMSRMSVMSSYPDGTDRGHIAPTTDRWLSAPNEPLYSRSILAQPLPDDVFNRFLAVARCSQPFLAGVFSGPLLQLEGRLTALWDSRARRGCLFYEEKRNLIIQATRYLVTLPILRKEAAASQQQMAAGQQFFTRTTQPRPFLVPVSNSKATLRSECYEVLFIITRLFHSAGVALQSPPPAPALPGPVPYIPYYAPQPSATAMPNRQRVADLARVAFHFRQFRGAADWKQPLNIFTFSRAQIQPPSLHAGVLPLSKKYYQHGAGVEAGTVERREKTPMASAVMYFIAKLMEIQDWEAEVRELLHCPWPHADPSQCQKNAGYAFDSKLQALVGTRTTLMSTVSPLLLFLRNPFTGSERPLGGSHINVSSSFFAPARPLTPRASVLDVRPRARLHEWGAGSRGAGF
jgi:hypothetical protein